MAQNDIKVLSTGGAQSLPVLTFQTEAAQTAIKAGEFVKWKSTGSPYVIPLADADGVIGTILGLVGLAKSDSTQTASADGTVDVYLPLPGVVYSLKSKTSTDVNTQAKINALCGDSVIIDLTGSTYTLDSSAGNAQTSPFTIVGGDPVATTVNVILKSGATFLGDQDLS